MKRNANRVVAFKRGPMDDPLMIAYRLMVASCQEAHRQCLQAVSSSVQNEASLKEEPSERMALLLACAQTCHTLLVLAKTESTHLNPIAAASYEICLSCAEACKSASELHSVANSCRSAAAACAEFVKQFESPV